MVRIAAPRSADEGEWLSLRLRLWPEGSEAEHLRCTEFASDSPLANEQAHAVHRALGFEEMERLVYFRRDLARGDSNDAPR